MPLSTESSLLSVPAAGSRRDVAYYFQQVRVLSAGKEFLVSVSPKD